MNQTEKAIAFRALHERDHAFIIAREISAMFEG